MRTRDVLISGAGIAGPALAFWLARRGLRPTVVERAPALRSGGNAVDFRGPTHLRVLSEMGLLAAIREKQTHMRELRFVDAEGRARVTLPASFASGDVEIERGDLTSILFDATRDRAEYVFDESITALEETPEGVDVTFARRRPQRFDLVMGADGLHSHVRTLAFGPEPTFLRFHGYYVATFRAPNHLGLDHEGRVFTVPGRAVSVTSARRRDEVTVMLVLAAPTLEIDARDTEAQKALLLDRFADVGWETSRLLEALPAAELYFDAVSEVRMREISRGRVTLVGDAAYGATVGGQGTGVAVVSAYLLAGELADAGGDWRVAFARYHAAIDRYARGCQANAKRMGPFFAPTSHAGIWLRDAMHRALTTPLMLPWFERMVASAASDLALPEYPR